jgi:hypothetical protein
MTEAPLPLASLKFSAGSPSVARTTMVLTAFEAPHASAYVNLKLSQHLQQWINGFRDLRAGCRGHKVHIVIILVYTSLILVLHRPTASASSCNPLPTFHNSLSLSVFPSPRSRRTELPHSHYKKSQALRPPRLLLSTSSFSTNLTPHPSTSLCLGMSWSS